MSSMVQSERPAHAIELVLSADSDIVATTEAVNDGCSRAEGQPGDHALVIRFEPGTRDHAWPGAVNIQAVNRWERAVRRFEQLPRLTIFVARGHCGGGAADLLLAADYRILARDAEVTLPVNDALVWPGMSLYRVTQQIGVARARQILLWNRSLTAATALEMGVVDEIGDEADDVIRRATSMGRSGADVAIRRRLMLEAPSTTYEEALGTQLAACDRELRRTHSGRT